MNKVQPILRKVVKAILWIVFILVFLFFAAALLIQVPAIQKKIIHAVTTYFSDKTHTKIEIKNVGISFPKSVVLDGLYLEDTGMDTLMYAGEIKINIALYDLFKNKIAISSVEVNDAKINLYSKENDPLFNYNFLLTTFKDTVSYAKTDTLSPSKWTFSLDHVQLQNVRFSYNDVYEGIKVSVYLKKAETTVQEINPVNGIYQFGDLFADGLTANILSDKSVNQKVAQPENKLPLIGAKTVRLRNSTISYVDSVDYMLVTSVINSCDLKDASIDVQKQLLLSDDVSLWKSTVEIQTFEPKLLPGNTTADATIPSANNWQIALNHIDFKDDSLIYKSGSKPAEFGVFNGDYQVYNNLSLEASDFFYSSDLTKFSLKKFSAKDQNNFSITSFETDFRMDQHSISAKKVKAATANSTLAADFTIQYSSLSELKDSMRFSNIYLNVKNMSLKNSDILYFKPDLRVHSFFKSSQNVSTFSGIVSGKINELKGRNLVVRTGFQTIMQTDFDITGLPDFQNAFFHFPNLRIISGKRDLVMMADTLIPNTIEIPDSLNLVIAFKGTKKSFESDILLNSSIGKSHLIASLDPDENFNGRLSMDAFDLGRLLKDTVLYGPVSMTADASGQGMELATVKAKVKAEATMLFLNRYTYHNLKMDGMVQNKEFSGKINLNDENAVFDFEGLVNLNPNKERLKFNLNLKGADLQKLHLAKKDLRLAFFAAADFERDSGNALNGQTQLRGKAGITKMIVAHQARKYVVDSFLAASVNELNKSASNVSKALVDINYMGTISPASLPQLLGQFINRYFPFSYSNRQVKTGDPSNFNFEIKLRNHPLFSQVLFPQLTEFEPGTIQGSFDSQSNDLKINASIIKIVYGTTEIRDLAAIVHSDAGALNFQISSKSISNAQINLDNFSLDGKMADGKIFANISSTGEKEFKKLQIKSLIVKDNANYKLVLDPKEFYVMNNQWEIASDNYIAFGKQGFLIHHLFINHAESQINMASVKNQFNDDLEVSIRNFRLDDISRIIEKEDSLFGGKVDGKVLFKRVAGGYGLVADVKVSDLVVRHTPIGILAVKASNPTSGKFDIDVNLSGPDNSLSASGYFLPGGGDNSISIKTDIQSLSLKTIQAFSFGQITEATGTVTGNFLAEGNVGTPDLTGELVFNNAFINPAFLNSRLELKHETIELKKDGIYFNSFTMLDKAQQKAVIDGSIQMKQFSDFKFALKLKSKDFLVFNTTARDQLNFFGRMVVDSDIDVSGPYSLPFVKAKVKMKKGSSFTFSVPEDKLTTDKGEDVVEFDNSLKFNPILNRGDKKGVQSSGMTGFDLTSIIEIDQEATLRLLMDPSSTDSLVVKGEAALSFTMDRSGKMTLTGAYNLNDGSYLVSLESVVKKKFAIKAGSTIIWNGDPLDAAISIDATYSVRASPYDLVADQISGLSDVDQGGYKQKYPFLVLLKLRGKILFPEISFEIQLPPQDKGILGGAVNQKLSMLNEDPSALNKQVFALLVLGRFVQENPFHTESGGTTALIRSTVGKFLSAQLNQLSSKWIPGVDLNFDVQSYEDYQTGQAQGRTQVEIGLKKQLFNERVSVQVGGAVDVEGDRATQNSVKDITSDVALEYKMTKDGRFRLKGYRHNQYEGAIEGQLIETGIGVVFVRDFNRWSRLFKSRRSDADSLKIKN